MKMPFPVTQRSAERVLLSLLIAACFVGFAAAAARLHLLAGFVVLVAGGISVAAVYCRFR